MKEMEAKSTIYTKYSNVIAAIGGVKKDSVNPFAKNKYASLSAILQAVNPACFAEKAVFRIISDEMVELNTPITYSTDNKGKKTDAVLSYFYKVKSEFVDTENGQRIEFTTHVPFDVTQGNPLQGYGSQRTYLQRYSYAEVFHIPLDDMDPDNGKNGANSQSNNAPQRAADNRQWLNPGTEKWRKGVEAIKTGSADMITTNKYYRFSKDNLIAFKKECGIEI